MPPEICHNWLPDKPTFSSSEHSTNEILPILSLITVETGKTTENWKQECKKTQNNSVSYLHHLLGASKFLFHWL